MFGVGTLTLTPSKGFSARLRPAIVALPDAQIPRMGGGLREIETVALGTRAAPRCHGEFSLCPRRATRYVLVLEILTELPARIIGSVARRSRGENRGPESRSADADSALSRAAAAIPRAARPLPNPRLHVLGIGQAGSEIVSRLIERGCLHARRVGQRVFAFVRFLRQLCGPPIQHASSSCRGSTSPGRLDGITPDGSSENLPAVRADGGLLRQASS